ncbi:hypothetical protein LFREDSHE_22910 [Shewanella baltica]
MSKVTVKGGVKAPYYQALIEVDCDVDAENLLIFDRFIPSFSMITPVSGIAKVIVPYRYTTTYDLIVGLTDNERTYAGKFVDGVQPQIIDGTITNILI